MKILFLCVANSARSQMAEGLARDLYLPHVEVRSAGSAPTQVNPMAIRAMAECQIDLTQHRSTAIDQELDESVDLVVTLCDDEVCPVVPSGVRKEHWPFPDPAGHDESDDEALERFRKVRDRIKSKLKAFGSEHSLC